MTDGWDDDEWKIGNKVIGLVAEHFSKLPEKSCHEVATLFLDNERRLHGAQFPKDAVIRLAEVLKRARTDGALVGRS